MTVVARQIDLLTGAWKRERFEAEFARVVSESQRARTPLSVILMDVDNLQELNDLHGRDAMDTCLGWLAAKISTLLDGAGPIGRIGGDDFAVYLRCPIEQARRYALQLRQAVPA